MSEARVSEYERWLVVAGALLVQLCLGSIYAYSVFSNPVANQFDFGSMPSFLAKDMWIQIPLAVEFLAFGATMILAGRLHDKFGPMLVTLLGGVLLGGGMILSGVVVHYDQSFWLFILTYGVMGGIGIGLAFISPIMVLQKWFPDMKGLISGVAVSGFGIGAFGVSKTAYWLMTRSITSTNLELLSTKGVEEATKGEIYTSFNLPYTMIMLGAIYMGIVLAGGFLLKDPPEGFKATGWNANVGVKTQKFHWKEMISTPSFWMLWGAFFLASAAGILVINNITNFSDKLDIASDSIVWIVGSLAIFSSIGSITWGWVSDKFGKGKTMMIMWGLQAAALFALFFAGKFHWGLLMLDVSIVGFCLGGNFALFPVTIADYFGTKNLGLNYGILFTAYGVAGTVAALLIVKNMGGESAYMMAFIIMAFVSLAPVAIAYFNKAPNTDVGDGRDRSQRKARPKKKGK